MFFSSWTNAIDAKGRTSVPAVFRDALGDQGAVFVWPSVHGPYLEGGGRALMEALQAEIIAKVAEGALSAIDAQAQQMVLLGDARQLSYDKTGRVVLPEIFRDHAALTQSATFVGLGNKFQIWNPDAHEARMDEARAQARASGPVMGLRL